MKYLTHLSIVLLMLALPRAAFGEESLQERCDKAVTILQTLAAAGKSVPAPVLEQCTGVAIVKIARGGFIVGGMGGKGIVLKNLGDGNWSAPAAFNMGGGSVGAQIGGDVIDYVFVLNNELALEMFTSANETQFDAGANATAGPDNAAANKKQLPGKSVYVYSDSDGAFAGATIGGSFINIQADVNQAAYGASVTTEQILSGDVKPPAYASGVIEKLVQSE